MFTSKRKTETVSTGMINTIIGNNSKIEGVLVASDPTRVDGLLQGEILSKSSVIVGESGVVKGDIRAVEILVAGTVYGNLKAEERIELTETGRVLGDLVTRSLVIDEGASFKGNCTMEVLEERKEKEDIRGDFPIDEPALSEEKPEGQKENEKGREKPNSQDKHPLL